LTGRGRSSPCADQWQDRFVIALAAIVFRSPADMAGAVGQLRSTG